jgi:hypothetical protein
MGRTTDILGSTGKYGLNLWTKGFRKAMYMSGAWGGVVVKALRYLLVGRSRDRFPVMSLYFSVTYFLPTVPRSWGRLSPW